MKHVMKGLTQTGLYNVRTWLEGFKILIESSWVQWF